MNVNSKKRLSVDEIKSLLLSLSQQEQYNSFSSIVDKILCVESIDDYWDLISNNSYKDDYEKIIDFLSPNGQFLDWLLKEMPIDKNIIYYDFPINRLSIHTQHLIATNSAPLFISSKLYSKRHGSPINALSLNAFEYYMFSFISYIYHPSVSKRINWNGATDSIYCKLVFKYLDTFLFNVQESSSLMQIALRSRSRPSFNSGFSRSPNCSMSTYTVNSSFNDSIIGRTRLVGKEKKNVDLTELYFTETLVQVICEFWLNVHSDSILTTGSPMRMGLSTVTNNSRPTVDQVCLVRLFLKHAYHFCYTASIPHLQPRTQIELDFLSKLNFYRQHVLPKFLIYKVYSYLEYCFSVWPADLSFNITLETWLSAIQPWRYTDSAQHQINQDTGLMINLDEWTPFIKDNIDLYSKLLLSFIKRISKMDLTVLKNAQMLFRVAKVLRQSNLGAYINRDHMMRPNSHMHIQGESVRSEIQSHASLLFVDLERTISRLEDGVSESDVQPRNWWQTIWDSIGSDTNSSNNAKRVIAYLAQSYEFLSAVLGVESAMGQSRAAERDDYSEFKNSQPEHIVTHRGSQLTDFGRFQVTHRLCKLDTQSQVDYYERPVCSYEVGPLVVACSRLSVLVTGQFEQQIQHCCLRRDFQGRLARLLFLGSMVPSTSATGTTQSSLDEHDLESWVGEQPPQLRIRFLASKTFLFWFMIAFLVLYLSLDVGPLAMVLGSALLYLIAAVAFVAVSDLLQCFQ